VKHTRDKSAVSPRQMFGHSRNTSTVSVASTAGSRIGEVCRVFRVPGECRVLTHRPSCLPT
jgi:hypothetical protein